MPELVYIASEASVNGIHGTTVWLKTYKKIMPLNGAGSVQTQGNSYNWVVLYMYVTLCI